jgi:CRISPR-associated protein Cas2
MRYFLVCYDVADPKRWRQLFRVMKKYGEHWQYSVFFCRLRAIERTKLEIELRKILHEEHDRAFLCDLGPDEFEAMAAFTALGAQKIQSERLRIL